MPQVDLERHDQLRPRARAREALLGHRVQDRQLPGGARERRRAHRAQADLLEGRPGGALQAGREGLRGVAGRVRRARQGRDQGGGRRARQGDRARGLRPGGRDRPDLLREDLLRRLPRRGRGLSRPAGRAGAHQPGRHRALHVPQPRVPGRGAGARRRAGAAHHALPRRDRRGRRPGRGQAGQGAEQARGRDGRPAGRVAAPRVRPRRLRGHLSRGGARPDRAQGQGRGPDAGGAGARGGARRPDRRPARRASA